MNREFFSYLITDPAFCTHDALVFEQTLETAFSKHQPNFALYRDKDFDDYETLAEIFVTVCKRFGVKAMLHNHAPLAARLGAFGVHYSSDKLCSMGLGDKGLFRVLSCHKKEEIVFAKEQGLDAVTYSPIFDSPNKPKPVGLESLKEISGTIALPIIALGGITTPKHIEAVQKSGASGFASIRYFFS
ncbi:MAG: thiamine phosphate synthase [Thiovulaceae bacterium]|nr:thiamine phosphate synthase [Sulfurimonadaceae bacterium]